MVTLPIAAGAFARTALALLGAVLIALFGFNLVSSLFGFEWMSRRSIRCLGICAGLMLAQLGSNVAAVVESALRAKG